MIREEVSVCVDVEVELLDSLITADIVRRDHEEVHM